MKKLFVCLLLLCSSNVFAFDVCNWDLDDRYISAEICTLPALEDLGFDCDTLPTKLENYNAYANAAQECHTFQSLKNDFIYYQGQYPTYLESDETALLFNTYINSANNYARASCQLLAAKWNPELHSFIYLQCMNGRLRMLIDELKEKIEDFG